jgi:hypothetical protein
MEERIGRYLTEHEIVHHVGARDDNRPEMLLLFPNQSAHVAWHRLLRTGKTLDVYMPPVATSYEPRRRRLYLPGDRRAA